MKTRLLILVAALALTHADAGVIARWDFNSPAPDSDISTGTLLPSIGTGTAILQGSPTGSFALGDTAGDSAPASDNSGWQTEGYPSATNSNKTAGVRFDVSTVGWESITVSWAQRNSSTASRYVRLQFTVDGSTFVDADLVEMTTNSVFCSQSVDLSAVSDVADNPLFGFRIVTEFESTATGLGTNAYVPTTADSYSANGTVRFDMVTVSGTAISDGNTHPYVFSNISEQTLRPGQSTGPLPFLVLDAESPASNLVAMVTSSDTDVVPQDNVVLAGNGAERTVNVTAGLQAGMSRLIISVVDPGGKSNSFSFAVNVLPANLPPVISAIPFCHTVMSVPAPPIRFTVGDPETPALGLSVSAVSGSPGLVPNTPEALAIGGAGSNRTLTITPVSGQNGIAPITLTVNDGTNSTAVLFPLMIVPSAATVFYEPFDYENGSVVSNSVSLWSSSSGTYGQCKVRDGQLQVTAAETEDVAAALIGAPYDKHSNIVLYACFRMKLLSLPAVKPGYFAHFGAGSGMRGRIYLGTSNAMQGFCRLFVSNGTDTNTTMLNWNLSTNVIYTVVERYMVNGPTTTLWLDPVAETDPGAVATDSVDPVSISVFGFRQDPSVGASILIDDLRMGLSFAAVTALPRPCSIPLRIQRNGGSVILSWTNSSFLLEAASAPSGAFTNVPNAFSPFTNMPVGPARYFRLRAE
jgi:hypothetical protein